MGGYDSANDTKDHIKRVQDLVNISAAIRVR